MKIITIANAFYGPNNISGGDFIFSEYNKRWKPGNQVRVCTNERGIEFCLKQDMQAKDLILFKSCFFDHFGFYIANITRTMCSAIYSLAMDWKAYDVVFAASEFLPDVVALAIAKLKNKRIRAVAAFYIEAPNILDPQYKGGRLRLLFYKIEQALALLLISRFSDYVFTSVEKQKEKLVGRKLISADKIMAVRGGIDTKFIDSVSEKHKIFDAVFLGRLHPQKNPDELIKIWDIVCKSVPGAKLLIIGEGVESQRLHNMISDLSLENNVKMVGTKMGAEKVGLLKSSKIFVSASHFDSGNLALDEALACGLPGVMYDVLLMKYPEGVVKVEFGNIEKFSGAVVELLQDKNLREQKSKAAKEFVKDLDWDPMSLRALKFIS